MPKAKKIQIGTGLLALVILLIISIAYLRANHRATDPGRQFLAQRQGPIEFYGQVIDQDGRPVPDATVMVSIRSWDSQPGTNGVTPYKTDADGRFSISGISGDALSVNDIVKTGYTDAGAGGPAPRSWFFGAKQTYHPAPSKPMVYRLWRTEGNPPEHLIRALAFFNVKPDGKAHTADLLRSTILQANDNDDAGDLQLTIERHIINGKQAKYAWGYTIQSVNGGIQLATTEDPFLWKAPETNYNLKLEKHFDPKSPDWKDQEILRVFIHSRNRGLYASGTLEIRPLYNIEDGIAAVTFTGIINPDGSPRLAEEGNYTYENYNAYKRGVERDRIGTFPD